MSASTLDVGGRRVHVNTYNGLLPGPLLRVRPGDRLRVRLTNLMRPMGIPPGATPPHTGHEPRWVAASTQLATVHMRLSRWPRAAKAVCSTVISISARGAAGPGEPIAG